MKIKYKIRKATFGPQHYVIDEQKKIVKIFYSNDKAVSWIKQRTQDFLDKEEF